MKRALLLSALLAAGPAQAAGGDPFQFLFLDADARAVALGGAYTALASDANALLYNPAWLGDVVRHEAAFMHNQHVAGISQQYLGLATRWGVGAMVNTVDYGDIPRTTIANPNGTLGTYGARDLAASVGYGRAWGTFFAGASAKFIRESIDTAVGKTWAADAGVAWRADSEEWLGPSLGLAVQNAGPDVRFQSGSESLPTSIRTGAAYTFDFKKRRSLVSADLSKSRSDAPVFGLGVETVAAEVLSLRLGYSSRNQAGWGVTGGVGFEVGDFSIDYAATPFGELGLTHRASVTFRFGPVREVEEPLPVRRYERPELRGWRAPGAIEKRPPARPAPKRDPRKIRY